MLKIEEIVQKADRYFNEPTEVKIDSKTGLYLQQVMLVDSLPKIAEEFDRDLREVLRYDLGWQDISPPFRKKHNPFDTVKREDSSDDIIRKYIVKQDVNPVKAVYFNCAFGAIGESTKDKTRFSGIIMGAANKDILQQHVEVAKKTIHNFALAYAILQRGNIILNSPNAFFDEINFHTYSNYF